MSPNRTPTTPPAAHGTERRRWGRAQQDPVQDPYKWTGKHAGPAVCPDCGAVYRDGRWHWGPAPDGAESLTCQACHRIADKYPAGIVTLAGSFVAGHRDALTQLARHQEQAEKQEHPLNRIMDVIEEAPDRLVVRTTDIHLPRRIGEAVARSFHGTLAEEFEEDGHFVRVTWRRND